MEVGIVVLELFCGCRRSGFKSYSVDVGIVVLELFCGCRHGGFSYFSWHCMEL